MTGHKLDHAGIRILWLRLRRPRLAAGVLSGTLIYILLFFISSMPGRLRFILSWAFVHTIFALHYAHDYYSTTSAGTANGAAMRRLALTHGVISFFYATGILALTINMVAGLI